MSILDNVCENNIRGKRFAIGTLICIVFVGTIIINSYQDKVFQPGMKGIQNTELRTEFKSLSISKSMKLQKRYLINWYNPPSYLTLRKDALHCGFDKCKYRNCNMTFQQKDVAKSDAVIFEGRRVLETVGFTRPSGQVWVFAAHEAPVSFDDTGKWWRKAHWRHGFNWTMTYDKDNTDIFLPYGEIRKYQNYVERDYQELAKRKTNGALMINSHCQTRGLREKYVKILSKYVPVEVLGSCGKRWNCGTHYVHDDCFNLLNTTYKFFLAFENAFCHQYFSEKVYENFNYDIILVVRGGSYNETLSTFPKGTVISTDSFTNI